MKRENEHKTTAATSVGEEKKKNKVSPETIAKERKDFLDTKGLRRPHT
jgi:hypothetical protein